MSNKATKKSSVVQPAKKSKPTKPDKKSLIQIEPLVCGCCAIDRGREHSKVINDALST